MAATGNVDVLVIGCGPARASAAIAAHDEGASVLVVEKRPEGGGNAPFAGGFLSDVRGGRRSATSRRSFSARRAAPWPGIRRRPQQLRSWIEKLGGEAVSVDPPPGSFPAVLPSWPHVPGSDGVRYWVVGGQPSVRRGEALWHLLSQNLARGITVRYGHAAARLAVSEDGGVCGAEVASGSGSQLVTASHGVVLACGGFEADDYFKDAFLPVPHLHRVGHDGNTGDAIRMTQQAGGALWHMPEFFGWYAFQADGHPAAFAIDFHGPGFVLVNGAGQRFGDETGYEVHERLRALLNVKLPPRPLPCAPRLRHLRRQHPARWRPQRRRGHPEPLSVESRQPRRGAAGLDQGSGQPRRARRAHRPGTVRPHPDADRFQRGSRRGARRAVRAARRVHGRSRPN